MVVFHFFPIFKNAILIFKKQNALIALENMVKEICVFLIKFIKLKLKKNKIKII
jgi:hypothetical protein